MLDGLQFNRKITSLIGQISEPDFWPSVYEFYASLAECDSFVAMIFRDNRRPEILKNLVQERHDKAFEDIYLQGAYLLSPLYQCHLDRRFGGFAIHEIAPDDFNHSEFYQQYYLYAGLTDQFVMAMQLDEHSTLALSLGKLNGEFNSEQLNLLRKAKELLAVILIKHCKLQSSPTASFDTKVQRAFELFASSVLTEREQAVIQLLLKGHSSKSTAKELGISVETERSYRKSAYPKLDVSSQSELFNLFLNSLKYAEKAEDSDPLSLVRR